MAKQTAEQKLAELEAKLAAAEAKLAKKSNLSLKVSQKGAVSLYGMGRFPVTLYGEQWAKVIDFAPEITAFIEANRSQLKTKAA